MITTVFDAYGSAATYRRTLVPTLALILVPTQLLAFLLRLASARADSAIVNGRLVMPAVDSPLMWVEFAVSALGWLLAILAGIAVVSGGRRGIAVSPFTAIGSAAAALIPAAFWLAVIVAGGLGVVFVAAQAGPVIGVGALVIVAVLVARLLVVLPAEMIAGSGAVHLAWEITRGRALRTAGTVIIGMALLPWLLTWPLGKLTELVARDVSSSRGTAIALGFFLQMLAALVFLIVVAGQSSTLAHAYEPAVSPAAEPGVAEAGRPWRYAALAAFALPALLTASLVAANPYHRPYVELSQNSFAAGRIITVAWPAGQHPVIVTEYGYYDCLDDECHERTAQNNDFPVGSEPTAAAVAANGDVLKGTEEYRDFGPRLRLKRCTRTGKCETGSLTPPNKNDLVQTRFALGSGPDGQLLIALAQQIPDAGKVALSLIRCATVQCESPQRTDFGTFEGSIDSAGNASFMMLPMQTGRRDAPQPVVRLHVGADGRPLATFLINTYAVVTTCDPGTCAAPKTRLHQAIEHVDPHLALNDVDAGLVIFEWHGQDLRFCKGWGNDVKEPCHVADVLPCCGGVASMLAVTDQGIFALRATEAPAPEGFHINIGQAPPKPQRLFLWHCPDLACATSEKIPLHVSDGPIGPMHLVSQPDGRVLILIDGGVNATVLSFKL